MKTILIRLLALSALSISISVASVASQTPPSPILNTLEVERLVSSNAPEDHARLSAHFAALAERYTADARRHTSMSRRFVGNPSRNLGAGMSVHCRRIAALNTQSATTVGELAAHHKALATGAPSTPPSDNARFDAGAGASAPTDEELDALAAEASTPAEHRALQEYFLTLAKRYTSDADSHARMARAYRGRPRGASSAAVHCDRLVSQSRDAAKEATEAASMHGQLADTAR